MSELFDRIGDRVKSALQEQVAAMRDDVQQRISVDVERRDGRVIRSKWGEPPRRDKRKLYESAKAETIRVGDVVAGSVSVETPYANWLNDPSQLNRPIYGPILSDSKDEIKSAIAEAIVTTPTE